MLSGHPHIQRLRFQESSVNGQLVQKLIVETNLNLSEQRTQSDAKKLERLQRFLKTLASNDFADFSEIEIRPYADDDCKEDDYGRNLVA